MKTIGYIGLGKMGQNMVLHLLERGISVVGYNRTREVTQAFISALPSLSGIFLPTFSLKDFVAKVPAPRVIWLMIPNGKPIDDGIQELLLSGLASGDTIIDGGNCWYKDSQRRQTMLWEKGISFIDCGTSGGLEGARNGANLTIGGDNETVLRLTWLWDSVSASSGWMYTGKSGSGHFVKMVHNGIEYAIDQALGEGFSVLAKAPYSLDLPTIAQTWNTGSIIQSKLLGLLGKALKKDPLLTSYSGVVGGGETGKWTVETAKTYNVSVTQIAEALKAREKSQIQQTFATKVVSALRFAYGGHTEVLGAKS